MNRRFTLYLVRHGETLSNRQRIMQGQLDTKLSDVGERQAQLVAKRLMNVRFTHMFSSDLARAADTCRAIAAASLETSAELVLDQRLRERSFGYLEGKPVSEYKKALEETDIPPHMFTPEGGETMEQVIHRAKDFFEEMCRLIAEPLISHNGSHTNGQAGNSPPSPATECDSTEFTPRGSIDEHAEVCKPLHIDIPATSQPGQDESTREVGTSRERCVNGRSTENCLNSGFSTDQDSPVVLIVSHGQLLLEFKRLIFEKCIDKSEGRRYLEANRISPNTAVSQFTMNVCYKYNKVCVRCLECLIVDDTSHLATSSENLTTHSIFQAL